MYQGRGLFKQLVALRDADASTVAVDASHLAASYGHSGGLYALVPPEDVNMAQEARQTVLDVLGQPWATSVAARLREPKLSGLPLLLHLAGQRQPLLSNMRAAIMLNTADTETRETLVADLLQLTEHLPVRLAQWCALLTGECDTGQPVVPWLVCELEAALQAAGTDAAGIAGSSVGRIISILQGTSQLPDQELPVQPSYLTYSGYSSLVAQLKYHQAGTADVLGDCVCSAELGVLSAWSDAACARLLRELHVALAATAGGAG